MELENANRTSGKWLPNRGSCPQIAKPCGNPICADQAMRAGGQRQRKDSISNIIAESAIHDAERIARECGVESGKCPLEAKGESRFLVLKKLAGK